MATVLETITSVLTNKCNQGDTGWDLVPAWPPDLFAAVATLTDRSGLYSDQIFNAHWQPGFVCTDDYVKRVSAQAREWRDTGEPPDRVKQMWKTLIRTHGQDPIYKPGPESHDWKVIVFELLAVSDETCKDVGFGPGAPHYPSEAIYKEHFIWREKQMKTSGKSVIGGQDLHYLPHSICQNVDPTIACVQPKACTPSVGCTLRSMTHNLALLPSMGQVTTHWHITLADEEGGASARPLNLLLLPFPYKISGMAFMPTSKSTAASGDRAFKIDPRSWLDGLTPAEFVEFVVELIEQARTESQAIHGVVMPEAALTYDFANQVAALLAQQSDLELFLTGAISDDGDREGRNSAIMFHFVKNEVAFRTVQSKHHRWCLEGDQIRRYQLGHVLDPQMRWWEEIDVSYRHCYTAVIRSGAAVSVLICEDLARYDPVLTVMNSLGPNIVIALLMDGPQVEQRWSGRYATALADDPGSAVLTLTSHGMVGRSSMPGDPAGREIALWKGAGGRTQALKLPQQCHALLLSLTGKPVRQHTLDGRQAGNVAVQFSLGSAYAVRHASPPRWA